VISDTDTVLLSRLETSRTLCWGKLELNSALQWSYKEFGHPLYKGN